MHGKILFRPIVTIDPLVLLRLLMICGCLLSIAFRRQDTCSTNGAYSSLVSVSQGKTAVLEVGRVVPKRVTSIAVNSECYNSRMFAGFGKIRKFGAVLIIGAMLCLGFAADFCVCLAQTPGPAAAVTSIEQARAAAAGGRYAEAIADYREALRIAPRNVDAEIGLAQAFRAVHNFDAAKQSLEQARREHPKNAAPLAMLGDLDLELQTYDAAIAHLTAALAIEPANLDARNRLAVAYKVKGGAADVAAALEQIAKVLARDPKNALALYTRAEIYANQNRDALALPDAEKVVELQPQNAHGRALLGKILVRAPAGAGPEEINARCGRAVAALEPLTSGAEDGLASRAAEPADSETLFLLSRAYRCAGEDEKAAATLEEFEKSSQNDRTTKENQTQAKHLVQQADELAMKNDFAGSLAVLQQAIAMDATYPGAYAQLAKLYYSAGDVEKASEAIEQALARAPYHPEYLYVQGKILEKQGKMDEALGAFQQTVLVNPKESDAYFEMGWIYQQRGERAKARVAYAKAVEISPEDPDYKRALAALNAGAAVTP
jgi:tetratricopeptide (TPR) repeat protein